jgi:thymidine phosphorylase
VATAAGNALEVIEVMETLTGTSVNAALWDLTVALGGEALALGGLAADREDGEGRVAEALESGAAAEVFGRMVAAQGGPADFVDRWPDRLPSAPVMMEIPALDDGYIARIDAEALGHVVVRLGGGRLRDGDRVNPSVGLSDLAGVGEEIGAGVPLAMVHAATEEAAGAAVQAVQAAYRISPDPPEEPPLILRRIA